MCWALKKSTKYRALVCVLAIPDGEVRYIKEVPVYVVTATSSGEYLYVLVPTTV